MPLFRISISLTDLSHACFKTDGLADNVYPAEISSIVSLVMRPTSTEEQQAQDIADRLVEYARSCMFKKNRVSPFESLCTPCYSNHVVVLTFATEGAFREGIYYRGGVSSPPLLVVVVLTLPICRRLMSTSPLHATMMKTLIGFPVSLL
jgi:hypothetical protein